MDTWEVLEERFDPRLLNQRETIFTIGNGYLGTRGSFEEGFPGEQSVTLIHGVYDDIPIVFTELVNSPNWAQLFLVADGRRFTMDNARIRSYTRRLNLHDGVLIRKLEWEIAPGQVLDMTIERFASLADEHLLGVRWTVRSMGYSGSLEFRAGLTSHIDTNGFVHWTWRDQGRLDQHTAHLSLKTRASGILLDEAFSLTLSSNPTYQYWDSMGSPELVAAAEIHPGEEIAAEKITAVYTSRDLPDPQQAARRKIMDASSVGYSRLKEDSQAAWKKEWERCNITIEGNDQADRAVRYNLFQLLIAAPRNDDRVSIPAKSLSGYGYRGHVFWDTEIFMLPFFIFTSPAIARNLLLYRYRTLPAARNKAKMLGYEGALYAWESAGTGQETTPRWVTGPDGTELVRIWCGDIEHHISADVAFAVYQYWQVTGDDDFMREYGAEIFLETAKFWASRARWNADRSQYVIEDVIGPDENHDHVNNNAYTNLLARWNILKAFELLDWLRSHGSEKAKTLETQLDLSTARLSHWRDVVEKIYQGYDPKTHLFEQFEGFFALDDPGLSSFEPRTKSVQALLGIQGAQQVQISKQPDVLMLLYLLERNYDQQIRKANWDYYTPRTDLAYGSSLGPSIQAAIAARIGDLDAAYSHFIHAAITDLEDVRGNSIDGLHVATAGGVWQSVVFGFAGIDPLGGAAITPEQLPDCFTRIHFRVQIRGEIVEVDLQGRPGEEHHCQDHGKSSSRRFPILGAIFDLDGVLTDTSELHYQAWKRVADEEGIPFNRQDNEALRGIPRRESLLLLLKGRQLPENRMEKMMERKNGYYLEAIQQLTPGDLLPGARRLLEELQQKGIRVAIGSASKNASRVIENLGIGDLVQAVSDGYSVERQKPAPDLFLHAASQLGIPPDQCIVFEDASAGITAALEAGMWAVRIGPADRIAAADMVIPNLETVKWDDIVSSLEFSGKEKSKR